MNLIPMAGEGKRFKDAGFTVHKPMIRISRHPMFAQAVRCMPRTEEKVFIVRKEHNLTEPILHYYPKAKIKILSKKTEGQLCTCLEARKLINKKEPLFIGACDHAMLWDNEHYEKLLEEYDVLVWVFTKQSNLLVNPESWGWIKSIDGESIGKIKFKEMVSLTPYNDYAMTGAFTFKTGKLFLKIADKVIKDDIRINGEFYVDSCIKTAKDMGLKVGMMVVSRYIGFGTPEDLDEYCWWEAWFRPYEEWK